MIGDDGVRIINTHDIVCRELGCNRGPTLYDFNRVSFLRATQIKSPRELHSSEWEQKCNHKNV